MVARKNCADQKNIDKVSSSNVRFCEVEQVYIVELVANNSNARTVGDLRYTETDLASSSRRNDYASPSCCKNSQSQQQENKHRELEDPRVLSKFTRSNNQHSRNDALSFQEKKEKTLDAIDEVLALLTKPCSQ